MATVTHTHSRRALLGVMAAAPAMAVPAIVYAAPIIDTGWLRAVANFRAAKAASDRIGVVYDACETEYFSRRTDRPVAPAVTPIHEGMTWAEIKNAVSDKAYADHELRVAEWNAESEVLRAAVFGETDTKWQKAADALSESIDALVEYPVRSLTPLAEKANILAKEFGDDVSGSEAIHLVHDIRRLSGGVA